jgi:hypothetical protein
MQMSEIFSDVSTEQQEAAKALVKDVPGITTEQALAAVRSSDNHDERKKVALMFKAKGKRESEPALQEQIKALMAEIDELKAKQAEARKPGNITAMGTSSVTYANMIHAKQQQLNGLLAKING